MDKTLDGLKKLFSHDYSLNYRIRDLAVNMAKKAADNRAAKAKEPEPAGGPQPAPEVIEAEVMVPKIFKSVKDIDLLVAELNKIRNRVSVAKQIRITWKEID